MPDRNSDALPVTRRFVAFYISALEILLLTYFLLTRRSIHQLFDYKISR